MCSINLFLFFEVGAKYVLLFCSHFSPKDSVSNCLGHLLHSVDVVVNEMSLSFDKFTDCR